MYLQIVENRWESGRSRQKVIATLGRVEALRLTEVVHHDQHFLFRTDVRGDGVTAVQAAGVAIPPSVRRL